MNNRSLQAVARAARAFLGCAIAAVAIPAAAQQVCSLPQRVTPSPPKTYPDANPKAPRDYHVLSVSWSPDHCFNILKKAETDPKILDKHRHQCASSNRFEWVVHGLWPQNLQAKNTSEHPRACESSESLPADLLRKHLCTLPGEDLMQNEWQAHGTCGWSAPSAYFSDIETIWSQLARPKVEQTVTTQKPAQDAVLTTAGDIKRAWAKANPDRIKPEMVRVSVSSGNFLKEVMVCMDKAYTPIPCPPGGTPDQQQIRARLLKTK
ncbi:ribonuclease T2 family protein [Variovorax sp. GB1R11]|uniref:ribonuclease T2 family protein n=1 Tax=Variovorax sp. GB1R11 TaxID=3443741 RepID=UPI003F445B05